MVFFKKICNYCSSMCFHSFLMHHILYLNINFMLKYYKQLVQKYRSEGRFFFLIYHNHVWKKKSDYSAVLPLLLRWSTTIIIANITSCNLIISNLMFSIEQLSKQGGYLQKLLNKLFFYYQVGRKKKYSFPPLRKIRLKKLNSNIHSNTTALYLSKLGST